MSNGTGDDGGLLLKVIVALFGGGAALKFAQFLTSLRSADTVNAERAALVAERAALVTERSELSDETRVLRKELDALGDKNATLVGVNATQAADLRDLRRRLQERDGKPFELDEDVKPNGQE